MRVIHLQVEYLIVRDTADVSGGRRNAVAKSRVRKQPRAWGHVKQLRTFVSLYLVISL